MAKKKSSVAAIGIGYRLSSHEKLCAERMKISENTSVSMSMRNLIN